MKVVIFEVKLAYRPYLNDDNDKAIPLDRIDICSPAFDLSKVPECLRKRFRDIFDTRNTDRLALHHSTNYPIELKPNIKPPYIRTYNISLAELKALEAYIEEALNKG